MLIKMKQLGKNTIIYGVGSSVQKFISLLLLPFFTHYITPEEYGVIAMIGIITMIILPIFSLGFGSSIGISYFKSRSLKKKEIVVRTSFFILLISSILAFILLFNFDNFLMKIMKIDDKYIHILQITILSTLFSIISSPFLLKLQFDEKAKTYVVINLVNSIIIACLSAYMVIFLKYSIYGIVIPQLIGNISLFIIIFLLTSKNSIIGYSLKIQKELLKNGIPLVPSFAFLFILMHANKYILQEFEGLDAVGIYSIGFNLGSVMSIITSAIATAWFPFFMSYINKQKEAEVVFGKIFTYYVYIVGSLCLMFFIFAKPMVMILMDESFYDSYVIIGFVAMTYYVLGMFNMLLPGIYFSQKVKYVSVVQLFASVLGLVSTYFLIKQYSLAGAAISLTWGHFLMVIITYWIIYYKNFISVKYEWGKLFFFTVFFMVIIIVNFIKTNHDITKSILLILSLFVILFNLKKSKGISNA